MAILFNLMAKAGEYKNSKGETKTRWHKCGVIIESTKSESGMALNIESLPTNFDGWLQAYKPTEKNQTDNQQNNIKDDANFNEQDIPF